MKRVTIAVSLVLGFACVGVADQYQRYGHAQTLYTIPLHGGAYYGGQASGTGGDSETRELLKLLLDEIKGLREDVAALKSVNPAAPVQGLRAAPKLDGKVVAAQACASCHSGKASKGGFPMFAEDGKTIRELSRIERKEVERRVKEGSMPPPPATLKPEQTAAILGHYAK